MSTVHHRIEKIWWHPSPPPWFLRCLEPVYAALSRRHLEQRAQASRAPDLPLISVGNITVGGSGKTPFVLWLAGQLKNAGYSPVILCRGDGGKATGPLQVQAHADPLQVGDEAVLLAQQSQCPIVAGRDRIKGAQIASQLGDILILDDGFQYRQLERICDIVLVPGEGIGNGYQLPAGPLREPVSALERADIIVRTGAEPLHPLTAKKEWHWQAVPERLYDMMQTGQHIPSCVYAATGIARPERFFDDLQSAGIRISGQRRYPDHHRYSHSDVRNLIASGNPVAVTAKDAVKLIAIWPSKQPLWVLPQSGSGETGLFEAIQNKINAGSNHPGEGL